MKTGIQGKPVPAQMSEQRFYLALILGMAVTVILIVGVTAVMLHRNFLTIGCDTAVLQSAIVNTVHGNFFSNNGAGGPNILGSHTTFLLLLAIPFYELIPSPDTLFLMQVCGVYSTVIPIYLVAQYILQRPILAFCVAASSLASPILLHMAFAPLHFETWIAAAAFWSYFFYLRNNVPGFWVSFAFAVCCGEQAGLIYIALGLGLLLVNDGLAWRKRYGIGALLAGLTWVLLAVLVITPLEKGSSSFNIFSYNYSQWNVAGAYGLPLAVFEHPRMAASYLANPIRWGHLASVVGPALFVIFFSWRSFLLLAPFPIYFLMSDQEFFLDFHAYYFSFAFFAGYVGVLLFLGPRKPEDRFGIVVLTSVILFNVILLGYAAGDYVQLSYGSDSYFCETLHEVFSAIPTTATVYSPHRFSAYLSNRENLVIGDLREKDLDFDAMVDAQFASTNVHSGQIDYIVCDFIADQCGWRQGYYDPNLVKRRVENVQRLIESGRWKTVWGQNDVTILKRVRQ
jgi:uncharacterized membrane protein